MQRKPNILATIVSFCGLSVLIPAMCIALPHGQEVVSGSATFKTPKAGSMVVTASDKTIVNYDSFDIQGNEKVQFVQPSSSATVLNRITGQKVSVIQGSLTANGRIFLVNPYGMYFGPSAVVNAGSIVASTLNIRNSDFTAGNYNFNVSTTDITGAQIQNEGTLTAINQKGAVVLLSPTVTNKGIIQAQAGKVVLAAAESVTLNFDGDGLINFALGDDIENAVIRQSGTISAPNGDVFLQAGTAQAVIKNVVNTDGVQAGNVINKQGGTIRLTSKHNIASKNVTVESSSVDARGGEIIAQQDISIDATQIHFRDSAEDRLNLQANNDFEIHGAKITIDALRHPQSVLASGGKMAFISDNPMQTDCRLASSDFKIAKNNGQLGYFHGKKDPIISASGSVQFAGYTGVSLKVEAKGAITVSDTISITGAESGLNPSDTDTALLQSAPTLILRSGLTTLQGFGFSVPHGGFTSGGSGTSINLNGGSITTSGGPIILNGAVFLGANTTLTTNNGYINISGAVNSKAGETAYGLTANSGTGTTTLQSAVGNSSNVSYLHVTAGSLDQNSTVTTTDGVTYTTNANIRGNITTSFSNIAINGNSVLDTNNVTITAGSDSGNVTFNGTVNAPGGHSLTVNSSSGAVQFVQAVGSSSTLTSLTVTAPTINQDSSVATSGAVSYSGAILLGGNITTNNSNLTLNGNVTRDTTNNVTLSTGAGAGDITLSGTVNGDTSGRNLTLSSGTGSIFMDGVIGGTQSLGTLTASGSLIDQDANVTTSSGVTYTGLVNLGANITSSGSIGITGDLVLDAASVTLNASSGSGNISLSGLVNGDVSGRNLTLTTNAGSITTSGTVGGVQPLGILTATGNAIHQISPVTTVGAVTYNGNSTIRRNITTSNSNITVNGSTTFDSSFDVTLSTSGGNIVANGTVDSSVPGFNVVFNAGSGHVTLNNAVGSSGHLGTLTLTGSLLDQNSSVVADGFITYNGPLTLGGNVTSVNHNITFNGTVVRDTVTSATVDAGTGVVSFASLLDADTSSRNITVNGGTATFTTHIGSVHPLNVVSATATTINQNGNLNAIGGVNYTGGVNLGGNITTTNTDIDITGSVVLNALTTTTLTSGTGNISLNATVDGNTSGRNLSLINTTGNVLIGGDIGDTQPIATLIATGGLVDQEFNVTTTGPVTFNGPTNLGGNITTTSGAITINGNSTRTTTDFLTLSTGSGANITFNGTVDGQFSGLTTVINAGSGTVTFNGLVGSMQTLGETDVTAATINQNYAMSTDGAVNYTGAVNLGASINTLNSPITITGNTVVKASSVSLGVGGGAADVTFNGTINGDTTGRQLAVDSGVGNVNINGIVGATHALGTFTATGGAINQIAAITAESAVTFTGTTYLGDNITLSHNNGTVRFNGDVIRNHQNNVTVYAPGVGSIVITATLNGDVPGRNLVLNAGTGSVMVTGPIGNTQPLASYTHIP